MKRISALCILIVFLFSSCTNRNYPREESANATSLIESSASSNNPIETLTDGVYIAYDRSKYTNVTAPKCYYADYQEIDDKFLINLFSSEPVFDEASAMYITDSEKGYNTYNGKKTGFYIMSYWTKRGNDYDTFGTHYYKEYSTAEELDFMPQSEIKNNLESTINKVVSTGIIFDAYTIKAENYSNNIANPNSDNVPPRPNFSSDEKDRSEGSDYYYIKARQTVDNVPIFTGRAGSSDTGTSSFGTEIRSVYTANGLEYLSIIAPYKVIKEAQTDGDFIALAKAEEIIKNKFENLLAFDPKTIETVELVYIPLHSGNSLILTPAWEFSDELGPLYRINAYTGEEII